MWNSDIPVPRKPRWQGIRASIHVVAVDGISQRFYPHPLIKTSAILSLDEDATLNTDEIDFAFMVWRSFPDRIVGYPARSHYWDDSKVGIMQSALSNFRPVCNCFIIELIWVLCSVPGVIPVSGQTTTVSFSPVPLFTIAIIILYIPSY